jgi:hypothetical protein
VCKEQHKEKEIAKLDQNDNRIKCHKAGERNVSSDEDPSLPPAWSGDEPSVAIDWNDMSGSPSLSPHRAMEVSSSRRPEPTVREKGAGLSSQSGARPFQEDQRVSRSHTVPGGPGAFEGRRDPTQWNDLPKQPAEHQPSPRHLINGSDRPDADSLKRRLSKARSTPPASTLSAPQGADTSAHPRRLQSLIIRGCGAPYVHVPLSAGGSQGPASDAMEAGRTILELLRE